MPSCPKRFRQIRVASISASRRATGGSRRNLGPFCALAMRSLPMVANVELTRNRNSCGDELIAQLSKLLAVVAPLRQRSFRGSLVDLGRTGQAGVLVFQSAEIQQAPRRADRIGDKFLITQVMDRPGKARVPMLHELAVGEVVAPNFPQLVGECVALLKEGFVHRVARRERVTCQMHDAGVGCCPADGAAAEIVERRPVNMALARGYRGMTAENALNPLRAVAR